MSLDVINNNPKMLREWIEQAKVREKSIVRNTRIHSFLFLKQSYERLVMILRFLIRR